MARRHVSFPWRPWTTVCAIFLLWFAATEFSWVNPLFLPPLNAVVRSFVDLSTTLDTYRDIVVTVMRAAIGLAISFAAAVPLGLLLGRLPRVYEFFELPVDFFRSIPSSALFFLFILFFGVGNASKVAVVVYGCSLIMLVGAIYGAQPTREKQDRVNMLKSFGATRLQVLYLAVLPDALPHIAASVRVCVSLALVLVIVTEMFLGSNDGLGHALYDRYLAYDIAAMFSLLIVLGVIGYLANKLSILAERHTAFWAPAQ